MSEINGIAIISFQEISSINSTSSISNLQRSQLTKELHQYRQNPNIIDKLAREGPVQVNWTIHDEESSIEIREADS